MSSFEELMKERRKLQKEMAEKSALEAYRKKLAATYDLPSVTVTTDRAPTSTMSSMVSPDIPDMGVLRFLILRLKRVLLMSSLLRWPLSRPSSLPLSLLLRA